MKAGALKERVTAVLKAVPEDSREEGSKIDWIAAQVGEKDVNAIRECLSLMIELGLAYTTVDGDSYSII